MHFVCCLYLCLDVFVSVYSLYLVVSYSSIFAILLYTHAIDCFVQLVFVRERGALDEFPDWCDPDDSWVGSQTPSWEICTFPSRIRP